MNHLFELKKYKDIWKEIIKRHIRKWKQQPGLSHS